MPCRSKIWLLMQIFRRTGGGRHGPPPHNYIYFIYFQITKRFQFFSNIRDIGQIKEATISLIFKSQVPTPVDDEFVGPLNLAHNPTLTWTLTGSFPLIRARIDELFTPPWLWQRDICFGPHSIALWSFWFSTFHKPSLSCVSLEPPGSILPTEELLVLQKHEKNNLQILCTLSASQASWKVSLPFPSPLFFGALSNELTLIASATYNTLFLQITCLNFMTN